MYKITYKDRSLYNPLDDERDLREPAIHLAVNEAGSADFIIDSDHPEAAVLETMKGILEIKDDEYVMYRGRILRISQGMNMEKSIESEGLLACLNDSIVCPFNFPSDFEEDEEYIEAAESGNVVCYFLKKLVENHNNNVTDEQKIKLGNVTVTDPNNYIIRSNSDYSNTWSTIQDKLVGSSLGGYVLARYEDDGTYIDYLSDFPYTNAQKVRFAKNLIDLTAEADATDLFTAIMPIGADGLTVSGLDDEIIGDDIVKSGKIIYSRSMSDRYGIITRIEKWDDVTEAVNLKSKAVAFLSSAGLLQTITVTACDLSFEDESATNFRIGRYTHVLSSRHNMELLMPLMELEISDLHDPSATEITLGRSVTVTQADFINSLKNEGDERMSELQIEFDKQKSELKQLADTTLEQYTQAVRNAEEIILRALESYTTVSDLETYKSEIQAALSILKDQITIEISNKTTELQQENDDLREKYEEYAKYFHFTQEGLLIGETGNELLLRLDNDVIQFLRGKVPALFITDTGVSANEIHSQELYIGNYALLAEEDGRISFRRMT